MAGPIVGKIPEFTTNEGEEEVKEIGVEEAPEEVKETPAELPAVEKPAIEETKESSKSDDTGNKQTDLEKAVQGLQDDRVKLLKEIQDLRGQKREIKQEELNKVQEKIDELKDLHPEDIQIVDRILRSKGYLRKDEVSKMFYDSVKNEELNKFLNKYPEYKPENDSNDINWNFLQRELGYYRMPDDPHLVSEVLERAHRAIQKISSDRDLSIKKRQVEVASVGSGGSQRSSSPKVSLDAHKRSILERGGWSEEEIKRIENKLS